LKHSELLHKIVEGSLREEMSNGKRQVTHNEEKLSTKDIERVQKCWITLNKSGFDGLDYYRDLIT